MLMPSGANLMIEKGPPHDYTIVGLFRIIKSFDQKIVVEQYKAQTEDADEQEFTVWLQRNGYIEKISSYGWHLGEYDFDPILNP